MGWAWVHMLLADFFHTKCVHAMLILIQELCAFYALCTYVLHGVHCRQSINMTCQGIVA